MLQHRFHLLPHFLLSLQHTPKTTRLYPMTETQEKNHDSAGSRFYFFHHSLPHLDWVGISFPCPHPFGEKWLNLLNSSDLLRASSLLYKISGSRDQSMAASPIVPPSSSRFAKSRCNPRSVWFRSVHPIPQK